MKTHEKELRWQGATRSIQWCGLPVATNVDPEFGPTLGAAHAVIGAALEVDYQFEWGSDDDKAAAIEKLRAALNQAGVL